MTKNGVFGYFTITEFIVFKIKFFFLQIYEQGTVDRRDTKWKMQRGNSLFNYKIIGYFEFYCPNIGVSVSYFNIFFEGPVRPRFMRQNHTNQFLAISNILVCVKNVSMPQYICFIACIQWHIISLTILVQQPKVSLIIFQSLFQEILWQCITW